MDGTGGPDGHRPGRGVGPFILRGLTAALSEAAARSAVPVTVSAAIPRLSDHVEHAAYLPELLADSAGGMGYLLKDRVSDIDSFLEALERVALGELVLDPDVVTQVMSAGRRNDPLESLTPREREVLGLMAQGHTNAAIAQLLVITEGRWRSTRSGSSPSWASCPTPPSTAASRRSWRSCRREIRTPVGISRPRSYR